MISHLLHLNGITSSEEEQLSPVRFSLFPLAFQVRFFPMSFLLSCGSHQEKMRPTCPSFWMEVHKSQRVRTSGWGPPPGRGGMDLLGGSPKGSPPPWRKWLGIAPSLSNPHKPLGSHNNLLDRPGLRLALYKSASRLKVAYSKYCNVIPLLDYL